MMYNTCILPIFLYGSECWAVTKRDVLKINALDQWCGMMMWDGQPSNHTFWLLATLCKFQMKQMPRRSWELPPCRSGKDHQDALVLRGWRLSIRTWNPTTCPWMKQLTCLRIVHSGDWCLLF